MPRRLRTLALAAALLGCASCGGTAAVSGPVAAPVAVPEATQPAAKVELDVFSGRPNPAWTLSDADRARLRERLDALPTAEPAELEGNLGYRGFVVRLAAGDAAGDTVTVQRGTVRVGGEDEAAAEYYRDANRDLERWLLDTGESEVEPEVAELVERELDA